MGKWSVAWRVHDAQFWGVPQRRQRIALVADFGGLTAPEILFERKGLSGNFDESRETRTGTAAGTENGACVSDRELRDDMPGNANSFQERAGCSGGGKGILIQEDRTGALSTLNNQSVYSFQGSEPLLLESNQNHATIHTDGISTALPASMGMGGGYVPMVLNDQGGQQMNVSKGVTATLRAAEHGHQPIILNDESDTL